MDLVLRGLNAAQRAAVTSTASVLQVLAPPGSGKTKTLTSRVAYLLSHHGYQPQNVICCTFTIKAAREMRERLRGIVGGDLEHKLILGTFHSICRRYLVAYGHLIGIPKNFGIADSDDSLGIIKRLQKEMKFAMDARAARNKISHRKARGQTLDKIVQKTAKSEEAREFIQIFEAYEAALATSNLLDYDDLLLKCVHLLRKYPECVSNIEALLIDEFQDTNIVQFELMKLLASARKHITIVGDPDQSIYGFRSAEIKNLVDMQEYYPGTVVINLEENYRSSSSVLALAQDVIEQDTDRPDKKLKSTHCYGTLPVLRRLPNPHEEASWIVKEIKRMTKLNGGMLEYSDIALLLRSAFLSLLIEKALANAGVPYKMVGGQRFFDRVEVRLVLDYLRTLCHPENDSALLSIINVPARKVGSGTLEEITKLADKKKWSIWATIQKILEGEASLAKKLSGPAERNLTEFVALINKGRKKLSSCDPSQAPAQLIEMVIDQARILEYLRSKYRDDWEERSENVNELAIQAKDVTLQTITLEDALPQIEGVQQAATEDGQEVLSRFLANVALSTEVESDDTTPIPRVTISTIHSAKGLEWPVVFVPACYEGSIPHSRAEDVNEERRLMYVAMTRAQALLYMTFPVMQSRGESESILTQFLPDHLHHRVRNTGPDFNDRVVRDISTILRRPMPTQEALARGMNDLENNESRSDDIWPEDGSSRNYSNSILESAFPGIALKSGQSLAEAVGHSTAFQTVGYLTSMHQFNTAPEAPDKDKDAVRPVDKRPKLVKSASSQGNINSFFTKRTLSTDSGKENLPPVPALRHAATEINVRQQEKIVSIPKELAEHRLGLGTTLKRPRPTPIDGSEIAVAPGTKRHYSNFSSSPTRENEADEHTAIDTQTQTTTTTGTAIKYHTTMTAIQQNRAQAGKTGYTGVILNTLNQTRTTTIGQAGNTGAKRSLGMRRPMTSWADRMKK